MNLLFLVILRNFPRRLTRALGKRLVAQQLLPLQSQASEVIQNTRAVLSACRQLSLQLMNTYGVTNRKPLLPIIPHFVCIRREGDSRAHSRRDRRSDPPHDHGVHCPPRLGFHRLLLLVWYQQRTVDETSFALCLQRVFQLRRPLGVILTVQRDR